MKEKRTRKNKDPRKKRNILSTMKMNDSIKDLLDQVSNMSSSINDILDQTNSLAILNKAKINNFLNYYISKIFNSIDATAAINAKILSNIKKNKDMMAPAEYTKLYLKSRELENDQLKLITEFVKCQDIKLDLQEQNMIIIYRSLPTVLKHLMYKTVMEFVRKCPEIQAELQKQKEQVQNQE